MRCQGLNQSVAHVVQQMPAVRYLYRLRRSFRGGLSIQAGTIAADDLYAGMRTQPARRCSPRYDQAADRLPRRFPSRRKSYRSDAPSAMPNRRCPTPAGLERNPSRPRSAIAAAGSSHWPGSPVAVPDENPPRRPAPM